jgi:hypothetical protein
MREGFRRAICLADISKTRGGAMYDLLRQLENGEFVHLESCDSLEQAARRVEELNAIWPGKYVVRDSKGNDVGVI